MCGLYDGAAYLSTSESYLRDLGVVRLIPRAAYSPEITVVLLSSSTTTGSTNSSTILNSNNFKWCIGLYRERPRVYSQCY